MSLRALVLQHVPFEGPGAIRQWLDAQGYDTRVCALHEGAALPSADDIHLLVVMGGPMGADDDQRYPFLTAEKAFIRDTLDRGLPVLGVCLGAQLLARVLGAEVRANPDKEIGWFPVRPVTEHPLAQLFADHPTVLHWHGDTFAIPAGATRLLESDACANQAFVFGRQAIGLQFHLEVDGAGVAALCQACANELVPAHFVQDAATLTAASTDGHLIERLFAVLDWLVTETP